jgi:hypothetical protein
LGHCFNQYFFASLKEQLLLPTFELVPNSFLNLCEDFRLISSYKGRKPQIFFILPDDGDPKRLLNCILSDQ